MLSLTVVSCNNTSSYISVLLMLFMSTRSQIVTILSWAELSRTELIFRCQLVTLSYCHVIRCHPNQALQRLGGKDLPSSNGNVHAQHKQIRVKGPVHFRLSFISLRSNNFKTRLYLIFNRYSLVLIYHWACHCSCHQDSDRQVETWLITIC